MPPDELVQLVHDISQNADSVFPDIVHHLLHANCLQLFRFSGALVEYLCVQIVMVIRDVFLRLAEQYHNVNTLFDLLAWEMGPQHINV